MYPIPVSGPITVRVTHGECGVMLVEKGRLMRIGNQFATWWFQRFFIFTPNLGKIPSLTHIFQMG